MTHHRLYSVRKNSSDPIFLLGYGSFNSPAISASLREYPLWICIAITNDDDEVFGRKASLTHRR